MNIQRKYKKVNSRQTMYTWFVYNKALWFLYGLADADLSNG
jgi:hypothetical protein